ncbi:MAG: hypothetical protein ORN85_01990 [Sediminibacterium sp.]|nr:hypothetical protein [Sediminibacterium sp.]
MLYLALLNLLAFCAKDYDIRLISPPTLLSDSVSEIRLYSAAINYHIDNKSNLSFNKFGICYDTLEANPTVLNTVLLLDSGVVKGEKKTDLTNLRINKTYYARPFASFNGVVYYGNPLQFTTASLPVVSLQFDSVTTKSVLVRTNIINSFNYSLSRFGIYYSSTNQQPTSSDSVILLSNNGILDGNYNFKISNLNPSVVYYVRYFFDINGISYIAKTAVNFTTASLPSVTTNVINAITAISAIANISISNPSSLFISKAGVVYSRTLTNPTVADSSLELSTVGSLAGNYTLNLTNLTTNSTYYVRGFINYNGTIYYGNVVSFIPQNYPPITTNAVTNITPNSATGGITITNPNNFSITTAGLVYSSTNATPTTSNSIVNSSSTGNLAGSYTINLTSLTSNTTYYVRGFINYNGTIYYGGVQSFTTATIPTITTNTITNITSNSATGGITITNPNNFSITTAGLVYSSTNATPTTSNSNVTNFPNTGNINGAFSINFSSLISGTTYYVRGFINYKGTIYYGEVQSFTTVSIPTVSTNPITNIGSTTAIASININNPGSQTISEAGILYSPIYTTPVINYSLVANISNTGNLSGNFSINLSSLQKSTTYYARAYISYNGSFYYGNVLSFTTSNLPQSVLDLANNFVTVPGGSFTMGCTFKQLQNNGDGFYTNYIYKIDFYLVNIPFILNNLPDLNISIKGITAMLEHQVPNKLP